MMVFEYFAQVHRLVQYFLYILTGSYTGFFAPPAKKASPPPTHLIGPT